VTYLVRAQGRPEMPGKGEIDDGCGKHRVVEVPRIFRYDKSNN